ncbi:hypothetical protein DL95DRAFT_115679 [Leptodontidium sp. 2 PMI_412]|nr:hypothetical protein DL95DRAFT_115679 [Leptodontidium sp. 2 PMI_412]
MRQHDYLGYYPSLLALVVCGEAGWLGFRGGTLRSFVILHYSDRGRSPRCAVAFHPPDPTRWCEAVIVELRRYIRLMASAFL